MRRITPVLASLAPLLLLLGCSGTKDSDTSGTDSPVDSHGDTDTGDTDTALPVDEDRDGYDSSVDCNDNNYQIYPGATEMCNGIDDDCDEFIDEDFDADGDGEFDAHACSHGTDCNDADPTIGLTRAEVPYDGIDQNCDGEDLTDVDGDFYLGGTGDDCDDTDPSVHPGAPEVPKDGVDQDCDGADDIDGDGDGYGDGDLGGDDCDDLDASVHPGARDYWGDGLDADCDGSDSAVAALSSATVTISGADGAQELAGEDVAICDIDGDTLPDLVVGAPFANGYTGQVGIFYGANRETWTSTLALTDADTLITSDSMFLGFEIGCADLDGDGNDDLVTGRGEIHYSSYNTSFELEIWYGGGGMWPAEMSESDGAATLRMPIGVTRNLTSVYGRNFSVTDLDADGASEIVLVNSADANLTGGDDSFYIIGGGRYSGTALLADEASSVISGEGISMAVALPDLDGDGTSELLVGEAAHGSDDSADTGYPGRASVVNADDVLVDGSVGGLAYGYWQGVGSEELGFSGAAGDFDGDSFGDLAVGALTESTRATDGGGLYLFAPAEAVAGGTSAAGAVVLGGTDAGLLGYAVANTGDANGDGADDLLVTELQADSTDGRVWLLDGARAFSSTVPEDSALLAWTGEAPGSYTGNALAVGDIDGDGASDFVIGAYGFASDGTNANGKVYVLLSGG